MLKLKKVDPGIVDYISDVEDLVFLNLLKGLDLSKFS
jgi:hypothetical protein